VRSFWAFVWCLPATGGDLGVVAALFSRAACPAETPAEVGGMFFVKRLAMLNVVPTGCVPLVLLVGLMACPLGLWPEVSTRPWSTAS
jgi:hypothetical protein